MYIMYNVYMYLQLYNVAQDSNMFYTSHIFKRIVSVESCEVHSKWTSISHG